jgi:metal-responsive CopG/Arc/MetJ family transcriptional regulator
LGEIAVKVLVSLPDELYARMQAVIPPRQRSKVVGDLLEEEVRRRERELYECALAVEQDERLHAEMTDWDVTVADGIETETW